MNTYILTATKNGRTLTTTYRDTDDIAAIYTAASIVLNKAHRHPAGPWAIGRIELMRGDEVLQVMEEK